MAATPPIPICRERVVSIQPQDDPAGFVLANQAKILLRPFLASYIGIGDEIAFPVPAKDTIRAEILITKNSGSGPNRYLYHVPIGYVSQPKQDKRNQHFVSAEVQRGKPWHRHDFPALRGPPRVLLSPAAYGRQSRSSHSVRGLAYPGQRFALRASRRFQTARFGAKDGGRAAARASGAGAGI